MAIIKHEHQLDSRELAFFKAVANDPTSRTDAREAIYRSFQDCFDVSGIPVGKRGNAAFNKARQLRRLFERRQIDVSWAGGVARRKKLGAKAASSAAPQSVPATTATLPPAATAPVDEVADLPPSVPTIKRYDRMLDRESYDSAVEDLRVLAMEAGTLSVALSALKMRAALHGLLKPAPEQEQEKEADPFEGMSDEQAERALEGLLREYKDLTGRNLSGAGVPDDEGEEQGG